MLRGRGRGPLSNSDRFPQAPCPVMLDPPAPWLRDHPSAWRPGTLDPEGLHRAADALCGQPGFDGHVRHFARCWQAGYDGNPLLGRAMRNNARYIMLVACLWLDHVRDHRDPADGITASRLLAFYEQLGRGLVRASPWRVKSMLAYARARGLLQLAAAPSGDARRRPLQPTSALREAMAGWVAGFLDGLAPLLPLPEAPARMVQRPGLVGEVFTYRLSALVLDRYAITRGLPALGWITDREKGYHLFLSLMRSFEPLPEGGARVLALPRPMAERAGVARTTVLNFIQAGTERGWFAPEADQHLRLTPAFTAEALQWFGREFLWMHTLACAAWERLQRGADVS